MPHGPRTRARPLLALPLCAGVLGAVVPARSVAQRPSGERIELAGPPSAPRPVSWAPTEPPYRARPPRDDGALSDPLGAAAASAVVPGAGQILNGRRRGWAFLAVEALGWVAWADRRSAASEWRDRYRDFAWERARVQPGVRIEGRFAYYETMSKWDRSGAFDVDGAAGGVQPEPDASSYNGSIWARAVGLYLPGGPTTPPSDPAYARALAYYEERAYGPDFLWDWQGATAERSEFGDLIEASDTRARQATNVLGAIIANHVVSAIDAFVGARAARTELRVVPSVAPRGPRWHVALRLDRLR